MTGQDFINAANLTDLNLDGLEFYIKHYHVYFRHPAEQDWEREDRTCDGVNMFMLMLCTRLERLSIKDTTYTYLNTLPVTQEMIVKLVRHTPTLRWLRSDLTEDNVAILQQERPDITFVTD
jgi:hypothetical protein